MIARRVLYSYGTESAMPSKSVARLRELRCQNGC